MVLTRQRLTALCVCAVATTLLVALVVHGGGDDRAATLLSGADGQAARLVQRRGMGEGGSQLADLIDSPLMLAKQKIDHYLNEDSDNLVEAARKMNVVGSNKGKGVPCTSLKCDNGVWQNDYLNTAEQRMEKTLNGEDPGKKAMTPDEQQSFMDSEKEFAGAAGLLDDDTMQQPEAPADMNALTKALTKKLDALKQHFREVRAQFTNGPGKTIRINVKPRGPRGPPGVPGKIGPQGPEGTIGSYGPPGKKGPPGPRGDQGVRGRKGPTGPKGSIGKPGGMGRKGGVGLPGLQGFTGAPGSRGLPGAAGAPGTNGKDGPPGPPGRNSPEGPPGPPGARGLNGATGSNGKNGENGPPGFKGQTGTTGNLGQTGATGAAGMDGFGPAPAKAVKKKGAWPKGDCYTRADPATALGVKENLCGKIEPLCTRCGADAGFKLKNSKGLRFKGFSFDDQNSGSGTNQVRNVCMLARYGNEGQFKGSTADIVSKASFAETSSDIEQPHWFGNCDPGAKGMETCCSNDQLVKPGFSWFAYGSGNDCLGDLDTDPVWTELTCVFSDAALKKGKIPPLPRDGDTLGGFLESIGEIDQTTYRSQNGKCDFILGNDGSAVVKKEGKAIWQQAFAGKASSPYKMVLGKNGNFVAYSGNGDAVWSSETDDEGVAEVRLSNTCCLTAQTAKGECKWSSCGCPKSTLPIEVVPGSPPAPPPSPPAPPEVAEPEVGTLYNKDGKSLLNIRCADYRDKAGTWAAAKQIEYYSKCMAQDCVQSLESSDDNPGCRFLDQQGFCYAYGSAQTWCAKNLGYAGCNDGGAKWATPPVGTAADAEASQWTPQKNILVVGSQGDGKTQYNCQCMKDCACTKETCRCFDPATRPIPEAAGAMKYPQYLDVFGDAADLKTEAAKKLTFNAGKWNSGKKAYLPNDGKMLVSSSKKGQCSCRCGEPVNGVNHVWIKG